jgi:carotenoid 1,2-hydratase
MPAQTAFDRKVPRNGYAWWYIDALADDGRHGLTIIAFIGSVFSPYYAWARRHDPAGGDPYDHCALNVALYGPGGRWAMTERGRAGVQASASALAIGPSALRWDGAALTVDIDEIAAPIPRRLRGRVRLHPAALMDRSYSLDAAGRHRWHPCAPCARVEVNLTHPALHWAGAAYFDSNAGDAPLEDAFSEWDWSRAHLHGGTETAVLYEAARRDGTRTSLAMKFDAAGTVSAFDPPPRVALPETGWRIARITRSDAATTARVERTLEDTPFYARSVLAATMLGERVTTVHESLSLDRFRAKWVQMLLPFRMPRRAP